MKTVIFNFGGTPTEGDLIMACVMAAGGGCSAAKCVIGDPATPDIYIEGTPIRRGFPKAQTLEGVAAMLAHHINSATGEWLGGTGDFKAVAKGNRLTVMASSALDNATFYCDIQGAKTETCEIEVL